jgi:hypothetical protein
MLRAIWFFVLAGLLIACTDDAAVQPDAAATPQSIVAAHLGPHLGMQMTPEVRACRESCWAQIPFDECAKQRDTCLETASSKADRHHCREMSFTCGKLRRECMQGCWLGKPPIGSLLEQAANGDAGNEPEIKHLGMKMTPAVRSCRKACWAKTPFNACAKQRDACLATASGDDAQHQCRVASMGCRKTRSSCMQSCWNGEAPASAIFEQAGGETDSDSDSDE